MSQLSELELQNLRHLIGGYETQPLQDAILCRRSNRPTG